MSRSEDLSRSFYAALGASGLANRTRPDWDQQVTDAVIAMLPAVAHVLDIGCGYGRVALRLARAGYEVDGLDLSDSLIEAASISARAEELQVLFVIASMTRLPYPAESFDAVICL